MTVKIWVVIVNDFILCIFIIVSEISWDFLRQISLLPSRSLVSKFSRWVGQMTISFFLLLILTFILLLSFSQFSSMLSVLLQLMLLVQKVLFDFIWVIAWIIQLLAIIVFLIHVRRVLTSLRLKSFCVLRVGKSKAVLFFLYLAEIGPRSEFLRDLKSICVWMKWGSRYVIVILSLRHLNFILVFELRWLEMLHRSIL